ncbi:MAG TPA: hypothetical protein VGR89_08890, partial [Puia sp.]|nr:hypothetical protein [Puia sp.]
MSYGQRKFLKARLHRQYHNKVPEDGRRWDRKLGSEPIRAAQSLHEDSAEETNGPGSIPDREVREKVRELNQGSQWT